MKKLIVIITYFFLTSIASSSIKDEIMNNLMNIENLSFNFEQNINGKVESGNCIIQYPKKIFCKYDLINKKILVSNGKTIVIKTSNGNYYSYPIEKTPLNFILDKEFLLDQIAKLKSNVINEKFINFSFLDNENKINIFFDINSFNLIGWQIIDIYQNLSITYISSLKKNLPIKKNQFLLPQIN